MMFVLLGLWYEIGTSNINTKPLKLRSLCFIFWVYFMRSKLYSFLFSLFTFAFFFSFKFGFMWGRNAGSHSDIVPIVWVLFCFLQTKNWVQVWVPNKNLSEIIKKRKRKGIMNWVKDGKLWVMRMRTNGLIGSLKGEKSRGEESRGEWFPLILSECF